MARTIKISKYEEIPTRNTILICLVLLLSLFPFVITQFGPDPTFLGLPLWYWITTGIFGVIYIFIMVYVKFNKETIKEMEPPGGDVRP